MDSRFYKYPHRGILLGVLAGVAEYIDVDPFLVRLIYLVISLGTGLIFSMLAYIIIAAIAPSKDD